MAITGKLGDLDVGELMLILASLAKSGTLTLSRPDGNGIVVLHGGRVVFAASDSVREAIGNILVCRGVLTEAGLRSAVEAQQRDGAGQPLGAVLVEMRLVNGADLESALQQQMEDAIVELLSWNEGRFVFDAQQHGRAASIGLDPRPLLERAGYALDGKGRAPASPAPAPADDAGSIAGLKPLMADIGPPSFTGEITQRIIACARGLMRRGVFFAVRHQVIAGMAEFGVKAGASHVGEWVRDLKVPREEDSVLADAARLGRTYRGPLPPSAWNERLRDHLGGGTPAEVLVLPMKVSGRVVVLLYCDNLPGREPIGPVDDLELLLAQMGLAMERKSAPRGHVRMRRATT